MIGDLISASPKNPSNLLNRAQPRPRQLIICRYEFLASPLHARWSATSFGVSEKSLNSLNRASAEGPRRQRSSQHHERDGLVPSQHRSSPSAWLDERPSSVAPEHLLIAAYFHVELAFLQTNTAHLPDPTIFTADFSLPRFHRSPLSTSAMSAVPIFDATVASLRDFDPDLYARLQEVKHNPDLQKLLNSDIDGTASRRTDNPAELVLVDGFLENCQSWIGKGGKVNWISARGVNEGSGNLQTINGGDPNIGLTGNDGCEAIIDGSLRHFVKPADLSAYISKLQAEREDYPLDPITVTPMGHHVLGVFVHNTHEAYKTFAAMMTRAALELTTTAGRAYQVKEHHIGITLELVEKTGKRAAVEGSGGIVRSALRSMAVTGITTSQRRRRSTPSPMVLPTRSSRTPLPLPPPPNNPVRSTMLGVSSQGRNNGRGSLAWLLRSCDGLSPRSKAIRRMGSLSGRLRF
jgi:hypothetical protein